ncbi:efflux RND transporter periplasmic adaptor subunit [Mucilaginibacter psychrotolerans]|uniref:Efflux RND transporter periplasmic adaptor subunit n=1 Tax=Mucilaginibacter psychrotolerans TaxID=1524096 RepID=A0A4Y8SBX7_9SPHI|nr:efflux RND transporter periplasmic adaptor subunit [Mucilaginibacter psychrotolerans]TFF36135.1 efflux RND transporter periplasmic adaptor subunit [Mucilaginibacter psychrotolerans]
MYKHKFILFFMLSICFFDCSNEPEKETKTSSVKNIFQKEAVLVEIADVSKGAFDLEILGNGKALAKRNADVRFQAQERIRRIFVKNGDVVNKGQVLAQLDDTESSKRVLRSKTLLEKAFVELDDRLIDYGYRLKDSARVPAGILQMAKVKSGFNNAVYDYSDARTSLRKNTIIAPFSGRIADLEAREDNNTDAFKHFCTLIDDSEIEIEFNVLESEFRFLSNGTKMAVIPYGDDSEVPGNVTQINPSIDVNGMIKITGTVNNKNKRLLNGMNLKVIIKKSIPNKIYIPKEALVQRDNRDVVFSFINGHAKWNYVETDLQNREYVCIRSGLKIGQKVIVTNNTNLAHDSEVKIAASVEKND